MTGTSFRGSIAKNQNFIFNPLDEVNSLPDEFNPKLSSFQIGNEISEEKVANAKQGTAVDWSKMGDVDTLFVASQVEHNI